MSSLPRQVVVVGAGIMGCASAYHLLKRGVPSVTVVDRGEPGCGTTRAGAGFVSLWAAGAMPIGPTGLGIEAESLEFYRQLSVAGEGIGYRSNGNLVLVLGEPGWQGRGNAILADRSAPVLAERLGPAEVAELTGGMVDARRVQGGVFMPSGIQIETDRAIAALVGKVRGLGGTFRTGVGVTGVDVVGGAVTGVTLGSETIDADAVVLCTGAWTNQLLDPLGVRVPLLPVVATRIVTESCGVPDTMPTIQCPELALWIRGAEGAFTWGTLGGYGVATDFTELTAGEPPDLPVDEALLAGLRRTQAGVAEVFPALAQASVRSWRQGIVAYTPDRNLVAGRVPGVPSIVALGGDNESGVTHGPGMGRLAAELVCGVEPFVDPTPLALDRFRAADYPDPESVLESVSEHAPFLRSLASVTG